MTDENAAVDVEETPEIEATEAEVTEPEITEEPVPEPLEPMSQWPADLREEFVTWAALQGESVNGRKIQERFLDFAQQSDRRMGELGQRLDSLNRQYQPLQGVLEDFKDDLAMAGMPPETAIRRALTMAKRMAADPEWGIKYLVKQGNLDLSKLAEDQPYVDPAIQQQLQPMERELMELRRERDERNRREQQAFNEKVQKAAREFESAEENGKPKYPYLRDVQQQVLDLAMPAIQRGEVPNYADLYEQACYANPEIRTKLIAEQTKQITSQKTAQAQKAKEASATVKGSGDGKAAPPLTSIRDSVKEASRKIYG